MKCGKKSQKSSWDRGVLVLWAGSPMYSKAWCSGGMAALKDHWNRATLHSAAIPTETWIQAGKHLWHLVIMFWIWKVCAGSCMHVQSLSRVPFATPWTVTGQAPLSMEFSRQEYWSELPVPSPGDLPNPGIKPASPALPALAEDSWPLGHLGSPWAGGFP